MLQSLIHHKIFLFGAFLLLIIFFVIFYISKASTWGGDSRYRFAFVSKTGDVFISILIPSKKEVQIAKLDPLAEVEAAHGLGKWKTSSLFKLGEQEKIEGNKLIRQTLIQGFGVPIEGVLIGNTKSIDRSSLISAILQGRGDIPFPTRVSILFFVLRTPINVWDEELNPKNILSLTEEPLNDVSDGIIKIVNKTKDKDVYILEVSRLIENLGGKILDISDEKEEPGICDVYGDSNFSRKLSLVFNCSYKKSTEDQKLVIYNGFLTRF